MSYSVPGCLPTLPSTDAGRSSACYSLPNDHGQPWTMVGLGSPLNNDVLSPALRDVGIPVGAGTVNQPQEGLPLAIGKAWVRFGMVPEWWVYNLTSNVDAGVTWDHGRMVRVHPSLLARIVAAANKTQPRWNAHRDETDRFVRVMSGTPHFRDPLLNELWTKMVQMGYASGTPWQENGHFTGGDTGPFVGGLKGAHEHLLGPASGALTWPQGFNYGPVTQHHNTRNHNDPMVGFQQLRIHPALLNAILNADVALSLTPKAIAALPKFKVRRVDGPLPKVQ